MLLRLQSLCELLQSRVQPSTMLAGPLHCFLEVGCSAADFLSADRVQTNSGDLHCPDGRQAISCKEQTVKQMHSLT